MKDIFNKTIVFAVMDRNSWLQNTDIIILFNFKDRTIKWIPRDLYSPLLNYRINFAYAKGGEKLLLECLKELNIIADYVVCVLPKCFEENIKRIGSILVPVKNKMHYYYPLHRHSPIEKGRKIVKFSPPYEILFEDRFHEWIGSRYNITPINTIYPDFDRIERQQILLNELLKNNIKNYVYSEKNTKGINNEVLFLLKTIDSSWKIEKLLSSDYICKRINKNSVLIKKK
jgi:anionic cell wall polymer biosynthesis LytR-Cps2A-Psr (LCP) family protein